MMRLRADNFAAALIRRCAAEGASAVLARRGAAEAGAIFIVIDRLDGRAALFGPAPQDELGDAQARGIERVWRRMHTDEWSTPGEIAARLVKEVRFDPDLWIIEIEDRRGRVFFDLADG